MAPLRRRRWLLGAALAGAHPTWAQPPLASPWPDLAHLQGQATLRFMGLAVYDARLWVGPQFNPLLPTQAPLGLELGYRRAIAGRRLVERSLEEMARCGSHPAHTVQGWRAFMTLAFPDVNAGDRLLGLWLPALGLTRLDAPATATRAARSQALVDADFGACFFGIWLAAHTSEPALRRRLLGLAT